MKITVAQVAQSQFPEVIGACSNDIPTICKYLNRAQQILINCGGESGFWGGWQKVVFQVSRCNPYITLPPRLARAINMDFCRFPVRIQNEFYEFLEGGIGLQDFYRTQGWQGRNDWCGATQGFDRGVFPSMVDLTNTNQLLRVYTTDPRDIGKRMLIGPAKDQNGNYIYSTDGNSNPNGFYLTFTNPFITSNMIVTSIEGIQKDLTFGDVLLYQVDATTGAQVLLSRYGPNETNPAYRRYYLNQLPCGCLCHTPGNPCLVGQPVNTNVPVTAMGKLEFYPVSQVTDWLVIGNIPALIEEAKAIRDSDMESAVGAALENKSHKRAIKLLQDEMRHYIGELSPAINYAPWGTARLSRRMAAVRNG